jgi:protocatechuate 3,4-dioxygenase beta subunit
MTELEMLRLANAGHLKLISHLAIERDDLLWQRDQLKEINDRMAEDRIRLIDERDAAREERDELLFKIPNY